MAESVMAECTFNRYSPAQRLVTEQLFTHRQRGLRLAYRILGNRTEAEDIVQTAFLRCYQAAERYHRDRSFTTWFFRVIANLCIDTIRKRQPLIGKIVSLNAYNQVFSDHDALEADVRAINPERQLIERSQIAIIIRELQRLPSPYGECLRLRQQGYSQEEIGQSLHRSLGAVKAHLSRGRKLLARKLEREGIVIAAALK